MEYAQGWAVAFTHPRGEDRVVWHAGLLGFSAYCPKIRYRRPLGGGRFRVRYEPLFPRYVFVQIKRQWYDLFSLLGVNTLIMSADKPAILEEGFVAELKKGTDKDGFYVPKRFVVGQSVRVTKGVLTGQIGIYDGMRGQSRVAVLLDMLGTKVRASVRELDLAAV